MATKVNPWRAAREDAGYSQLDAVYELRNRLPRRLCPDPARLSRFETGGYAKIDAIALAVLAEVYGKKLRDIDPATADELEEIQEAVDSLSRRKRRKYAPRDSNPEPAGNGELTPFCDIGGPEVTSVTAPIRGSRRVAA